MTDTIPPAVIADAVAAAKAYARVVGDEEEALVARLCTTALALAEAFCGQAFVARTREDVIVAHGGWQRLRGLPVAAIAGLTAVPADAAPSVLAIADYAVDIDADGVGWVRTRMPGRVAVSYTAGLAASWAAVPDAVAQGVVMLVAHLFANRDGDAQPPAAVAALWRPYRRLRLAVERHS